jgi:ectoine hydroxylase-related dioxygenase (phytanoyl-CoA dioxygenase family)
VILAVDDMPIERGPTHIVPGTHRGTALPPKDRQYQPLPGEVALTMKAGSATFINGAVWHSKGHNVSPEMRRVIILGYGYWWLKRWFYDQDLPWQALVGASEDRLRLLGLKQPEDNFHYYDPTR